MVFRFRFRFRERVGRAKQSRVSPQVAALGSGTRHGAARQERAGESTVPVHPGLIWLEAARKGRGGGWTFRIPCASLSVFSFRARPPSLGGAPPRAPPLPRSPPRPRWPGGPSPRRQTPSLISLPFPGCCLPILREGKCLETFSGILDSESSLEARGTIETIAASPRICA